MILSVIIPCYNHGAFIDEAIESVALCRGVEYEIIIVNDGSTDDTTKQKLASLAQSGYCVINHSNQGLAYSRNAGIATAKGKYILPLDADNKIKPEYIYKALDILEKGNADIVYAKPVFFGAIEKKRMFNCMPFNSKALHFENYIDACALYRKEVWVATGGYSENMPFQGQEDWEFWLHAFIKGFKFHFIDEELYYYRIVKNSMIETSTEKDKEDANFKFILNKHTSSYIPLMKENYTAWLIRKYENEHQVKTAVKYIGKYLKSAFN